MSFLSIGLKLNCGAFSLLLLSSCFIATHSYAGRVRVYESKEATKPLREFVEKNCEKDILKCIPHAISARDQILPRLKAGFQKLTLSEKQNISQVCPPGKAHELMYCWFKNTAKLKKKKPGSRLASASNGIVSALNQYRLFAYISAKIDMQGPNARMDAAYADREKFWIDPFEVSSADEENKSEEVIDWSQLEPIDVEVTPEKQVVAEKKEEAGPTPIVSKEENKAGISAAPKEDPTVATGEKDKDGEKYRSSTSVLKIINQKKNNLIRSYKKNADQPEQFNKDLADATFKIIKYLSELEQNPEVEAKAELVVFRKYLEQNIGTEEKPTPDVLIGEIYLSRLPFSAFNSAFCPWYLKVGEKDSSALRIISKSTFDCGQSAD